MLPGAAPASTEAAAWRMKRTASAFTDATYVGLSPLAAFVVVTATTGLIPPVHVGLDSPAATARVRFTPHMSDLAIDIRNVVKRYAEHVAVRDLSLRVPRGAVYGLLGPNGAGKTTTIRMILNIIVPDSGSIALFGQSHLADGVTDRIGYLPEERGLYKKMQVRRVLRFLAELKGVDGADADRRIEEWLERFQLRTAEKDWGLSKIDELSRGMQQKVQFIGTLLHDPDLVILDEPFSGLDPINAQALKDTIVELKARGKTVIFSTHLMDNAERLCDAVCIIAHGDKVLDGEVGQVKAAHGGRVVALAVAGEARPAIAGILADRSLVARVDDQNRFYEIDLAPGADPQQLLRRVVETGAPIQRFELVQPSLHQIFLEKVGASGVEEGMSGQG
jgi:ABC-2 type transport system ATP-binding protein